MREHVRTLNGVFSLICVLILINISMFNTDVLRTIVYEYICMPVIKQYCI